MTDKELDQLIYNKITQQQFEYNDAYWEKASVLINANKFQLKKLAWYRTSFYASSLLVFCLMGWFLISKKKETNINTNTKINQEITYNEVENASSNNIVTKGNNQNLNKTLQGNKNENLIKLSIPKTKKEVINVNSLKEVKSIDDIKSIITSNETEQDYINGFKLNYFENQLAEPTYIENNKFNLTKYKKQPDVKNKYLTSLNASLEGGFNSFNTTFNNYSMGYYVGGRIYFDIGKFSFNTNIHYENINQNLPARTIINKSYDFTSNTNITEIKNQSIDYAIIGLNLMYPVYKNNSLGIGFQYALLVQSNDLYTNTNIETNKKSQQNTNNFSSNLNNTDYQITINYQNRFAKHLAINAAYVYGLNNISNSNNLSFKNEGLKLGIQYIIK